MNEETKITNFAWLNKNIVEIGEEDWHDDMVMKISNIPDYEFFEPGSIEVGNINPKDIKGINYFPDYNSSKDITWMGLLNELKRFYRIKKNMKSHAQLIEHVHNDYKIERRTVSKYRDIYITTCGQHRLCLAKFLNVEKVTVTITEYKINWEQYERFLKSTLQLTKTKEYISPLYYF